jgi:hypothetical protein
MGIHDGASGGSFSPYTALNVTALNVVESTVAGKNFFGQLTEIKNLYASMQMLLNRLLAGLPHEMCIFCIFQPASRQP